MSTQTRSPEFDRISHRARPYPSYLLPDSGTGLALFAAGFLGWNDVVHFARARMVCTCVDTDAENIKTMARAYPDDWDFRIEDAWVFAEQAAASSRVWDVVSVDPFFEDCARKVWESLDLWLLLAGDMMTLTVHADTELAADGWTSSYFPRGHDVGWMVFRRD